MSASLWMKASQWRIIDMMNASRENGSARLKMLAYIDKLLGAFCNTNQFHPSHAHFAQAQVSNIPISLWLSH